MTNNKDKKVLNVPNLRFSEFTGEWKKCIIGELTTKVGSGVTPRGGEAVYKSEGHPFVRSQNVGLGHLILDDIAYIDEDTHQRQKNTELQLDDVLLNITGASIGRSALVNQQIVGGNVNQHVCIIRANKKLIPSFLCNFLLSQYGQKQIESFQAGGNRQGLNFEQIKSIKIGLPSVEEQKKIADLLLLIEQRIITQNKIIEKYESLIQAICNTLIEAEQPKVELSFNDFGEPYSGLSGKSSEDFGKGCQYITYMNVYQNQIIDITDVGFVKINETEQQSVVRYGDILFTLSSETPNEVGLGAVYLGDTYPLYLNSFCFGVHIIDESKIFPPFLAYYISTKSFRKAVFPLAQGSTRFNLQKSDFMKKKFLFPTVEKQNKIYSVLKAYSDKLSIEKNIANLLCEQKSYLLRQLFI